MVLDWGFTELIIIAVSGAFGYGVRFLQNKGFLMGGGGPNQGPTKRG